MHDKLQELQTLLSSYNKVLIAYSGGVDSTFLLKAAKDALGDNVLAVIGSSPTYPKQELNGAIALCQKLDARCIVIKTAEFDDKDFISNPTERCYYCKKELFTQLKNIAQKERIDHILDGSNVDDKKDFRPGSKAKQELGVRSPLMELGFSKQEIRDLSKELSLSTWDKPSCACLASRIPYGTTITLELIKRIEAGEIFLKELGFKELRVRHHGNLVRIEVDPASLPKIMNEEIMRQISNKFEDLGYIYVTLDLKGYRLGSMNEIMIDYA